MQISALGINHKTAPVALRERVAFSADDIVDSLQSICALPGYDEAMIISTCNRTEIYVCGADVALEPLADWLCGERNIALSELQESLYQLQDRAAIRHLMRVASGLDSMILGEPQILGQVKQAYSYSKSANTLDTLLDRFCQQSFACAKRVRTETEIGAAAVSVAYAAVNLAKQIFADLEQSRVLLIGAGETIELVATHLREQGAHRMMVANRTLARAATLAENFGAEAITLGQIPERMAQADIVISSTAAPLPIIGAGMVERALKERRRSPMLLIDLAVPRDIEAEVADIDEAYVYTVDDLQGIIVRNQASRQAAAEEAELIIDQQVEQFLGWMQGQHAVGSIRRYRDQAESSKHELLAKALNQLEQGADPQMVCIELANKLTNRLIHAPTRAIQSAGQAGELHKLALIKDVLGIESEIPTETKVSKER